MAMVQCHLSVWNGGYTIFRNYDNIMMGCSLVIVDVVHYYLGELRGPISILWGSLNLGDKMKKENNWPEKQWDEMYVGEEDTESMIFY